MELGKSLEDYLEAVLILTNKNGSVRSVDIARHMNFSKASISRAVKELRKKGYLTVEHNGFLHLTEKGTKLAEEIYERHQLFTEILISLGVDETTAAQDACRMEHVLSRKSFESIQIFYQAWNVKK